MGECILDPDKNCTVCGKCDLCDLDESKICDNCCRCLETSDYRGIAVTKVIKPEAVKVKWRHSSKNSLKGEEH